MSVSTKITLSEGVDSRYYSLCEKVLEKCKKPINIGDFSWRQINPPYEIRICNDEDYKKGYERLRTAEPRISEGRIPSFESYQDLIQGKMSTREFLFNKPLIAIDTSLGYWVPLAPANEDYDVSIKSVIGISMDSIAARASILAGRLGEESDSRLKEVLFEVTLTHELGHQNTFSDYTLNEYFEIPPDLNLVEGLANYFVVLKNSKEAQFVLALVSLEQKACYGYYHKMRFSNIQPFLERLVSKDYSLAERRFAEFLGTPVRQNGNLFNVIGDYLTFHMDWNKTGGDILCEGSLGPLGPVFDSIVVAKCVKAISGCISDGSIIICNEIDSLLDYDKPPDNMIIIPQEVASVTDSIQENNRYTGRQRAIMTAEALLRRVYSPGI